VVFPPRPPVFGLERPFAPPALPGPPPLDVKPGPGGRVPEVYQYRPANGRGMPSRNIRVQDQDDGRRKTSIIGPGSVIGYVVDGAAQIYGVDVLGSTGIQVVANRKRGYTTVAGLRFRSDVVLNLWREGVVEVSRAGVTALDEDGGRYVSRAVTVNGRNAIVMVKAGGSTGRP
jgi:hypothetical protein